MAVGDGDVAVGAVVAVGSAPPEHANAATIITVARLRANNLVNDDTRNDIVLLRTLRVMLRYFIVIYLSSVNSLMTKSHIGHQYFDGIFNY